MSDTTVYPPQALVGHGHFRLSWWDDARTVLAGVEIWPDVTDPEEAPGYMLLVRTARPEELQPESEFGFRRRCAWCAVVLRGWQLNMCRRCKDAHNSHASAPCGQGSRWKEEPDRWRSKT